MRNFFPLSLAAPGYLLLAGGIGGKQTKRAFVGETLTDVLGAVLHVQANLSALPGATPRRVRELLIIEPHRVEEHAERRKRLNLSGGKPSKVIAAEERSRRKLVRRSHFMTIVAAWIITVPAAAAMSAVIFLVLNRLAG